MHLSRSSSRIVMVTFGIRIMAKLPDREDDQLRVDHGSQSGHFYLAESGHFYLGITPSLRSLGRYGARCARRLQRFSGLFTDRLARSCRLIGERLLRWRDGSICCAVSPRDRNASTLFRKTLSAFCCVRGRLSVTLPHHGGGVCLEGKSTAGVGLTCTGVQELASPPVGLPPWET
jgi:hypothetical protein